MRRAVERFGLPAALALAFCARAVALVFSVEHYGDGPVRVELAERWAAAPHLWRGFSEAYQFGPLHLSLLGAALRAFPDRFWAPRLLSFACGMLGVWLLHRVARRVAGPAAAAFAACILALSPIHIQASATSASEAVFLALLLGALDLLLAARAEEPPRFGRLAAAAVLLGAAGLVRYDGWLYVPLFSALLLVGRRDRAALVRAAAFGALAAVPALLWLWQCGRSGGALLPLRYIDQDHRNLAAMAIAAEGPLRYRAARILYWPAAVLVVATPVAGALALSGAARALWRRARGWELVALGWIPAAYLTFRTAVLADFWPMARFTLVAATLSLPFAFDAVERLAARAGRRAAAAALALALCGLVGTPLALALASSGRTDSLAEWARPLSPVSSTPPGIAEAARFLRERAAAGDVVLVDSVWDYLDIPLAFATGFPESRLVRRRWPDFEARMARTPPTLAVLLYQGELGPEAGLSSPLPDRDRFVFRGTPFCAAAKFVYAAVYRRCGEAGSAAR